ncbi:MAG: hypothetical protein ACSHYB_00755 [Roseibacillus sp.]
MSDFFESARSSGVIGMTLMLCLLLGFGTLFLAVFDDRLNGEGASRLKETVQEQASEIYILEGEVDWAGAELEAQERFGIMLEELDQTSKELDVLTQKEGSLIAQIEDERKMIHKIGEERITYQEEYRVFARRDAIGETIEVLTLASGKVLKNVKIREILPDRIRFKTEYGTTSVAWEDFADDMKERFQIGESEVEEHQAKIDAIQTRKNQVAAKGLTDRGIYLREVELRRSLSQIGWSLNEKIRKRDSAMVKENALRTKAKDYRTKAAALTTTYQYST